MVYVAPIIIIVILISWITSSVMDIVKCFKLRHTYSRAWWKELKETTQFLFVVIIFALFCFSFVAIANLE